MKNPARSCVRCASPLPTGHPAERPCPACLFGLGMGGGEAPPLVRTGLDPGPAPAASPEELAPAFPNLEIEALLGQGGMGVVYRARQRDLDRPVALKILRAPSGGDPGEEAAFAERFTREARALARLDHPNIVRVYDFGRAGEHYFLLMELVEGQHLRARMQAGRVPAPRALEIVAQISDALRYAHEAGIVHRDVKPENILVDDEGHVRIVDFGLAKITRTEESALRLTHTGQAMGTPQYMAPEQIERPLEVDHRADIYSLGVVIYELLTGELPLGRFAPPSRKVAIDVRLDDVVLRSLEKEPELRYQKVSQVQSDLDEVRRRPRHHGTTRSDRKRRFREGRRAERKRASHRILVWLGVGCLLMVLLPAGCLALYLGRSVEGSGVTIERLTEDLPAPAPVQTPARNEGPAPISIPEGYRMIGETEDRAPADPGSPGTPSEAPPEEGTFLSEEDLRRIQEEVRTEEENR